VQREMNLETASEQEDGNERARAAADHVARTSYGKLVAFLAMRTRDVAAAEDALSDAFATALAEWSDGGCPRNPEAWLLTVARRKLIDNFRGAQRREALASELSLIEEALHTPVTDEIPDERLAMIFACAHPSIDAGVRAPLILQTVLGLDAKRIASAFLASPAAMSKRLVRAKEKIRQAGIPFRVPAREELPQRLGAVLDAIYAAIAEGWTDPAGADTARRDLAEEALFLARLVTMLLPGEAEALGLLALLLYAEARRLARRGASGEFVPLAEQDQALWDRALIAEAEALLLRASALGDIGRFQLEAAIQSAHVDRCLHSVTNWSHVVGLYDGLFALTGSPVVLLNRALAIAALDGPASGLAAMPSASDDPRLIEYQPYWAARADLLARNGASAEARAALEIAMGLERDPAVRRFLEQRRAALPD
jgi:RNA polymerase sigma factor (sigma-70 family)